MQKVASQLDVAPGRPPEEHNMTRAEAYSSMANSGASVGVKAMRVAVPVASNQPARVDVLSIKDKLIVFSIYLHRLEISVVNHLLIDVFQFLFHFSIVLMNLKVAKQR